MKKLIGPKGLDAFSTLKKPAFIKAIDGPVALIARVVNGRLEILGDIELGTTAIEKGVTDLAKRLEAIAAEAADKAKEQSVQVLQTDFSDPSKYREVVVSTVKDGELVA